MTKPLAYIFDLDGTLAHKGDRSPYDWKNVSKDTPDEPLINTLKMYHKNGYTILIVSGRDGSCNEETKAWLSEHSIPYHFLFMREAGDNRKDSIVKKQIFDECIKDFFDVVAVYDDRDQVVEMWRSLGLRCYQVAEGNF